MKQNIILLYAAQYRIQDEKTGEIKEGITANYYFNTELSVVDNANGSVGTRPAKGSIPIDCFRKIVKAPAIYDATFTMNIGSDGKPVLTIADLDFVGEVEIKPVESKAANAPGAK